MELVDPLGRVQGKLSSAAGSRLFSRVKVSDARGLSSLAEVCFSNINNVSDAADVSSIKFQHTSFFYQLFAELLDITHLSVHAKAYSVSRIIFPYYFFQDTLCRALQCDRKPPRATIKKYLGAPDELRRMTAFKEVCKCDIDLI